MNTDLENALTTHTVVFPRNELVVLEWVKKTSSIELPKKTKGDGHLVVVAVGPGRITEEGKRICTDHLQVGDKVMLQGPGRGYEANGRKYMLVPSNAIWAVYTGEISDPTD